jgi:hypothetical protein
MEFGLPEIGPEDWRPALRERFAEGDIEIADPQLDAIITASAGHPRRTMLIASNVHVAARMHIDGSASAALVELAIADAEKDRSWA